MGCSRARSASSLLSLQRGTEVWEQLVAQEWGEGGHSPRSRQDEPGDSQGSAHGGLALKDHGET